MPLGERGQGSRSDMNATGANSVLGSPLSRNQRKGAGVWGADCVQPSSGIVRLEGSRSLPYPAGKIGHLLATNSLEFLQTSVDEETGSVVTRETGSDSSAEGSGSWEGVTNLWWVVKVEGEWKIAGSLHHILGT